MAYASGSRRGGSRRGGSGARRGRGGGGGGGGGGSRRARGGRRGPPPRGANNTVPMIVAGIIVAAVIAVIIVMGGGKKKQRRVEEPEELTANSKVDKTVALPTERPEPYPEISREIILQAKEIVKWLEGEKAEGEQHYQEAMEAKDRGDETTWQAKLNEARVHFQNINERWNEEIVEAIMGELPPDCPYDADQVANYHVGKEAGKVTKALERLAYINKQLRAN